MANLLEITGQESGIVIYGDKVIVTNWGSYTTGLPVMSPLDTVMEWPEHDPLTVSQEDYVEDIRTVLPGSLAVQGDELTAVNMEILADAFGDIPALWGYELAVHAAASPVLDEAGNLAPTPGHVYHINDAIVIAPNGWN